MVTPEYLSWGGVGSYVEQLSRNLPSEHEVHVICLGGEGRSDDRVTVHSLGESKGSFVSNNQFQVSLWRRFRDLRRRHGFDLVHSNHAQMADILLKVLGEDVPSVTTVHSTIMSQRNGTRLSQVPLAKLEPSERMTYLLLPALTALERMYMSRCSSVIYVSEFIRDHCVERFGAPPSSKVIHNGIDTGMFRPRPRDECLERFPQLKDADRMVVFSGRMIALKGIRTALEAQARMPRDVTFVFAGNGSAETWKAMAAQLGLDERRCRFIGAVSYADMRYLYPLASAFMLPSHSESLPMTVLEAMSCGAPVVATSVGGVPEMVSDGANGLLVPPGDAGALAEALASVLSDDSLARRMGEEARRRTLEEFSVRVMAERTAGVYAAALEGAS